MQDIFAFEVLSNGSVILGLYILLAYITPIVAKRVNKFLASKDKTD